MSAIRRPDRGYDWWVDFELRGKRTRRRSPVQTKAGALRFEAQLRDEVEGRDLFGADVPGGTPLRRVEARAGGPTFAEFAEKYLATYVSVHMRASSQRSAQSKFRAHLVPYFGERRLNEIDGLEIAGFTSDQRRKGLAPKSINNHLSLLHSALSTAASWGIVASAPRVKWVRAPEPDTRFLEHEEVRRLIAAASPAFWRPFLAFLAYTGARFGEAAALRWEDLELDTASPFVIIRRAVAENVVGPTKTGRLRRVPLVPELVRELRAFRHGREFVFSRPADGAFLNPSSTRKLLHKLCHRAGLEAISWHVLRHSFATSLTARRVPLNEVQLLLGHTSIEMTARYAHAAPTSLRASVMLLESSALSS